MKHCDVADRTQAALLAARLVDAERWLRRPRFPLN
jgi:hypothetical protein